MERGDPAGLSAGGGAARECPWGRGAVAPQARGVKPLCARRRTPAAQPCRAGRTQPTRAFKISAPRDSKLIRAFTLNQMLFRIVYTNAPFIGTIS